MLIGTSLYKSPMLINNSAGYFYDFLLTYVIEIFSSCDSHSLEEVSKMIVEVWPNIAVAVSLMRLVMSYSNEDDQSEIVKTVAVNFRIFKSFFLAFIVGPLNGKIKEYCMYICIILFVTLHISEISSNDLL